MARILLIDDDEICLDITGRLLQLHGYEFTGARTGGDGVRLAREWKPDVALVDLRLPDRSGIDVLAQLKAECPDTSRVMFSGFATLDVAVDAMRLGVCDCLTKPAFEEDIVAAVERALAQHPHVDDCDRAESALSPSEAHAAARWAQPIVRVIDVRQDPRTLREFGRAVFVSVGCFRNWCRTTRVSSRASLSFARALRAVYRFEHDRSTRPENLLSIVDQRTIAKFVRKCGGAGDHLPDSVAEFFERQQFISNPEALEAVRNALRSRQARAVKGFTAAAARTAAADRSGSTRDQP
ncbi:MAG: response regulator [Vicinamibacterales bacterium]